MDFFHAGLLYTKESLPRWKKFVYLFSAIIFTIGTFLGACRIFRESVFLLFFIIPIFLFAYFSGRIYSLSLPESLGFDYKFKKYDFFECEERRGFSFSFIKPKNLISAAKYVENLGRDTEKEEAKKQISYFIDFLNKTNNFSITLCDANKIAKHGTTDERRGISLFFKIFFIFISSFSPILSEAVRSSFYHPWYFYALCFVVYFLGQFFWFRFGEYRSQSIYVRNPEYENLTDKINSKEVVQNYITDPRSSLYYPTTRYDVYATYSELDFTKIVEIFSFNENDIDFLCKRLIEIDYLRLKEQTRQESLHPEYVSFTNFLFHNCIILNIVMLFVMGIK